MQISFDYYDRAPMKPDIPEPLKSETSMIERFAATHDQLRPIVHNCSFCGSDGLTIGFDRCGIRYYICPSCHALVSDTTEKEHRMYSENIDLADFRKSTEFQNAAEKYMGVEWDEFCQWMRIRCHRHLEKCNGLSILDVDDRYTGLRERISSTDICGKYEAVSSEGFDGMADIQADVVLLNSLLQRMGDPKGLIDKIGAALKPGALAIMYLRLGTSFDILSLGAHANIVPYEHMTLPSKRAVESILKGSGMTLLDFTTTGESELWWVLENLDWVKKDGFVTHLLKNADEQILSEFQYFLQRSGYGMCARIVIRKEVPE